MYQSPNPPPPKTGWSWSTFVIGAVVGIFVGVIGVFAVGALLFEGQISADLKEAEAEQSAIEQVQSLSAQLGTCDAHDRRCHMENKAQVDRIDAAMTNQPPALGNAITSFSTEYESFTSRNCGIVKTNVMCGLAGMNMNVAVSTIKTESAELGG